jgi:hypothetical protein
MSRCSVNQLENTNPVVCPLSMFDFIGSVGMTGPVSEFRFILTIRLHEEL